MWDSAIVEIVQQHAIRVNLETAAQRLVGAAMERGSRDNVTALVVRHEADK